MQLRRLYSTFDLIDLSMVAEPLQAGERMTRFLPLWPQMHDELAAFADFLEGASRANDMAD